MAKEEEWEEGGDDTREPRRSCPSSAPLVRQSSHLCYLFHLSICVSGRSVRRARLFEAEEKIVVDNSLVFGPHGA